MSRDDLDLWRKVTSGVKRHKSKLYQHDKKRSEIKISTNTARSRVVHKRKHSSMLTVNDESGIDKSTRKKIDTGQYYIDAEIDLHGLTKDEAFQALVHFVDKNFLDHKRLLLVITGKGKKSNEGSVKLKDEFPKWINHEYLNGKVVRFSYAAKHHGGDGAYYVFLRRERGR